MIIHEGVLVVEFVLRVPLEVPVVEVWLVLVEVETVAVLDSALLFEVVSLFRCWGNGQDEERFKRESRRTLPK